MNAVPTSALFAIVILLLIISGFFSSSETALMAINRYRLKHKADSGNKRAQVILQLLERPDRLIGLILLGNNFVNILASALVTVIATRLYGDGAIPIAAGILTLLLLIFSEVLPKTLAAVNPDKVAYPASPLLKILGVVLLPIVMLINLITNGLLRLIGQAKSIGDSGQALSSAELRTLVMESKTLIPQHHQEMLMSILDLEALTVEDIMIPRNELEGVDLSDDWSEVLDEIKRTPYSRVVVYENDVNELIGILKMKTLAMQSQSGKEFDKEVLLSLLEEPYYVPEGTSLQTQLLHFQKNRRRFGLVVDEYGDIMGAITLEDILEEIVGEFTSDPTSTLRSQISKSVTDDSYIIDASMAVRLINRTLDTNFPEDEARTLNGLILEALEDIPTAGMKTAINGHNLEIMRMDGRRVKTVKIMPFAEPAAKSVA